MMPWSSIHAMTFNDPPHFKRCAQVIAAWRSAGVLTAAFAPVLGALPRLAGVTSPRQRWLGANTP